LYVAALGSHAGVDLGSGSARPARFGSRAGELSDGYEGAVSQQDLLDKESRTSRVQPTDVLQFSICVLHEFLGGKNKVLLLLKFGFIYTHQLARHGESFPVQHICWQ